MFGAAIRLALGFAGSMLVASVVKKVLDSHVLPTLADTIGKTNVLYRSLDGVMIWLPLIVFMTAVIALVYRGIIERRIAGA